jgi:hypothetical protein
MKYKVGDKVKVRSWNDMEKEFGLNEYGDINNKCLLFAEQMKEWCGKTVTISNVYEGHYIIKEGGWQWTDDMFEDINNEFTKDDLEVNMIVELRDGTKGILHKLENELYVIYNDVYNGFLNYKQNLIHNKHKNLDILKVYQPKHPDQLISENWEDAELIWERKENDKENIKEITIDELEKQYGCKVKIVKDRIK